VVEEEIVKSVEEPVE